MTNTDFPRLVKALRDKRGFTQEELAHEIGVSFSTVTTTMRATEPGTDRIAKAARSSQW